MAHGMQVCARLDAHLGISGRFRYLGTVTPVRDRLAEVFPRELVSYLTLRELRGKFKRSALGWLWSVINPLASIAIYSVVFGIFLKVEPPVGDPSGLDAYSLFLVCGLLPWTFVTNGLTGSVSSIVMNEGLVKKVYFPRWVLPTSATLAWLASFGVELIVLAVILMIAGNAVLLWTPVVLVLMVLQLGFVLGLGLALSAANAYFRDVQHFLAIFLNLWFYATPILYPVDLPPEHYEILGVEVPIRRLLELNPMTTFVDAYRDVLYHLRAPNTAEWLGMVLITGTSLVLGALVFRRLEPRLAEEL
jgi:ABC-2 type transport system permease protein